MIDWADAMVVMITGSVALAIIGVGGRGLPRRWLVLAMVGMLLLLSGFGVVLLLGRLGSSWGFSGAIAGPLTAIGVSLLIWVLAFGVVGYGRLRQREEGLKASNRLLEGELERALLDRREAIWREERLLSALDHHTIVSLADAEGRILSVNRKFQEVSQYGENELIGQDYRKLQSGLEPEEFFREMGETLRVGRVWHGSYANRRKDGTLCWLESTIVPLPDESGRPFQYIAMQTDITRQKEAEEELIRQHSRLEEKVRKRTADLAIARDEALAANKAKSVFLATMSHEIRTPLNVVLGMLELMRQESLGPREGEYVQVAYASGKRLQGLLNDVLDFSKIEAGRLELDHRDFDLRRVIDEVTLGLAHLAQGRGVSLTAFVPVGMPTRVWGDPDRLGQVFTNLLGNAIKFTPDRGSVELIAGLVERVAGGRIEYLFEIRDSGIGILPEKRQEIFQRFTQADSSTTRRYGGSGLGLSISKHLVTLMGGEIGVDDNPYAPSGSIFHFSVVLQEHPLGPGDAGIGLSLEGMDLLAVVDHGLQSDQLKDFLEHCGARFRHVLTLVEAEALLREAGAAGWSYPLVIVNVDHLGEMWEELGRLRHDLLAKSRVLLLIGRMDRGFDQAEALPGMPACLQKPFSLDQLAEVVARLLGRRGRMLALDAGEGASSGGLEPPGHWRQARILVVDDQTANLKVARGMLSYLGCDPARVAVATNGLQAVERYQQGDLDLIFMDCQMPVLDGAQATRAIREWELAGERQRVAVVAFSADNTTESRRFCREAGMDGFLAKPITLEDLKGALQRHLPGSVKAVTTERLAPAPAPLKISHSYSRQLDVAAAMEGIGLPAANHQEVAEVILEQLPEVFRALERDVAGENPEGARANTHALKGSMATVIFSELKIPAERLYREVRAGSWHEAKGTLAEIRAIFAPIRRALKSHIDGKTGPGGNRLR
ncbi:MAG: response regulator [Magnetococcales bacterium]|nr:response regulator [Magnetococcales bacterium]